MVRRNGALERANRRFYLLAFVGAGAQLKTEAETAAEAEAETETAAERAQKRILARAIILLKAELLQGSHRLQPYCLVLLDNYRITSKTFYLVSWVGGSRLMREEVHRSGRSVHYTSLI